MSLTPDAPADPRFTPVIDEHGRPAVYDARTGRYAPFQSEALVTEAVAALTDRRVAPYLFNWFEPTV